MLHRLTANQPSFHTIDFGPGLNLIVARRIPDGDGRCTSNNRMGKTTVNAIIDFCLGANARDNSETLPMAQLSGWEFTLDATLGGVRIQVTRSVNDRNKVFVRGEVSRLPIHTPNVDIYRGSMYSLDRWKQVLGALLFDLPIDGSCPISFRSLMSDFIRRSYNDATLPMDKEMALQKEIRLAYLHGMYWEFIKRIQEINAKLERSEAIKKGEELRIEDWNLIPRTLSAQIIRLQSEIETMEGELDRFRTDASIEDLTQEADIQTAFLKKLRQKMCILRARKREIEAALEEDEVQFEPFEDVYAESRVVIAPECLAEIQSVRRFHEQITQHRRRILESEKTSAESELQECAREYTRIDSVRSILLERMAQAGALEDYHRQLEILSDKRNKCELLVKCRDRLEEATRLVAEQKQAKITEKQIALNQHEQRLTIWQNVVDKYVELGKQIYGDNYPCEYAIRVKPGIRDKHGYIFDPVFPDDGSNGVNQMSVFAFDFAMFLQQRRIDHPIDFMIHDSELYDLTDASHSAIALGIAAKICRENNLQYICGINADKMESPDFAANLPSGVLDDAHRFELVDDGRPESRLLGILFGRRPQANA